MNELQSFVYCTHTEANVTLVAFSEMMTEMYYYGTVECTYQSNNIIIIIIQILL